VGITKLFKGEAFKLLKNKGALNLSDLKSGFKNGILDLKSSIKQGYKDFKSSLKGAENVEDAAKDTSSVIKGGKYSETEIKNILNNLKGDGYKNNPLRQAYESEVAGLKAYGDELLSSGMSEEKVAQALNQARRDLGIKYKNATPQPLRDYIYEINRGRYGDELGPTYDYLIGKGKNDIDIINSSSRPNSNIDSLLSGFEEWLRRQ
jgi:hypothetical protein